jgi:hypothetical protein
MREIPQPASASLAEPWITPVDPGAAGGQRCR